MVTLVRKVYLGCYLFKNNEVKNNLARISARRHHRVTLAEAPMFLVPRALDSTGEKLDASATVVPKRSDFPISHCS